VTPAIPDVAWLAIACSQCGEPLSRNDTGAQCLRCHTKYPRSPEGALDLRLAQPKRATLDFELGPPMEVPDGLRIAPLRMNSHAEVDFAGLDVPVHMTRELMSYFPRARTPDSLLLDLACGNSVHQGVAQAAGFNWVGVDYAPSSRAPILADAHALPFLDESFECVLSVAAIHLFRYPFVMMREVARVLQPGGIFLGTVAFLEPFHDDGFYHFTHRGTLNALQYARLEVEQLAPSREWSALTAQALMALFPKMPAIMSRSIVYPVQLLHRAWWRMGWLATHNPNASEEVRVRNTTAAFAFVARKPGVTRAG
jgi:ubiquinone/menaquinone biosynthesis C-methylase UbiE